MRLLLVALMVILSLTATVLGQSDLTEARMSGTFAIQYPSEWDIQQKDGFGYFFETPDSVIRIRHYDPVFQGNYDYGVGDLPAMMEWLVTDVFESRDFDENEIVDVHFGGDQGIVYTFEEQSEGETYSRVIYLRLLPNNFVVAGNVQSLEGTALNQDDVANLERVIASAEQTLTLEHYEGTVFQTPPEWTIESDYNADFAVANFENGPLHIEVILYPGYAGMAGLQEPDDFYAWVYDLDYRGVEPLNRSEFEDIKVAGFDAVFDPVTSEQLNAAGLFERGFVSFVLPNNSGYVVRVSSENTSDTIDPVYDLLDTLNPGRVFVCPLFADPGMRIRSEPSTTSEVVRETADEVLVALEAVHDGNGYRWFHVGEGFVRSDVIYHEITACSRIAGY